MKINFTYFFQLHLLLLFALPSLVFGRTPNHSNRTSSQTFYVDAQSGNDGNNGLSPATAWQTLSHVTAAQSVLQAGDEILFQRGQVFYGQLRLRASNVKYGVYGSGAMPVISGFSTLSGWTSIGGGVYEAACNSGASLNMVTVNDAVAGMGRYPNADAANGGYLTINSHNGTSTISSIALGGSPSFTGGEAVIRKRHWVLDRCLITSHNGSTIAYNSPTSFDAIDGFGFFIQNHPATLDRLGEWWYDATNKKLRMYFGGSQPTDFMVKAATIDTLVNVQYGFSSQATTGIQLNDLQFVGSDSIGINVYYSQQLAITNCHLDYSGCYGINADNADGMMVKNCTISRSNNKGINTMYSNYVQVDNSTVKSTGLLAGMGLSNNQNYTGIGLTCDRGCRVTNSRADSSGYCGIAITGDSFFVQRNFVTNFCLTVDDGGGIYTWGADGRVGRRILNNIVIGGKGASAGTELTANSNAHGINLDDRSVNVEIDGNSVSACNGSAITIHNSHQVAFTNNTTYDAQSQVTLNHDNLEPDVPIRNVIVKKNILVAKTIQQYALLNSSLSEDFSSFGLLDSNYYCRPTDSAGLILNYYMGNVIAHDLNVWQSSYGHDSHTSNGFSMIPYKINSTGSNIATNGNFNANTNGTNCNSAPAACAITWSSGPLDGGNMKVSAGGSDILFTNIDLGMVNAGKDYLLRFSTLGTGKKISMAATIMHSGGAYENRSGGNYFPLLTTRRDNEFIFHSNNSEPVFLVLKLYGIDAPFYVDNVSFSEVNAQVTNPDDSIRFVYNETTIPKTIALSGNYKDVKNVQYAGTITLQPFSSAVLLQLQGPAAPNQMPMAHAGADTVLLLPANTASLNGTQSYDPDGSIAAFSWSLISGPPQYVFPASGNAVATASGLTQGVYLFQLSITDNAGAIAHDTLRVDVMNSTLPITGSPRIPIGSGSPVVLDVSLFPNPSSGIVHLQYTDNSNGNVNAVIYNASGIAVARQTLQKTRTGVKADFDISQLPAGVYILEIHRANGNKLTRNFVKQ